MFALVGFIQQMLGTSEDYIRNFSGLETSGTRQFENLIVETEALGQDTTLTGLTRAGDRVHILTQYKFSRTPDRKIYPKEVEEMAQKFNASLRKGNLSHANTSLVLRSNRKMSPGGEASLHKFGIDYKHYSPAEAKSILHDYVLQFGIHCRDEASTGIRNVISHLMEVAAGPEPHIIEKGDFVRALTGCENAQSIVIASAASRFREELEHQASECIESEGTTLVFRKDVEDAMKEWDYDALIVITGKGGYGKTTALLQVLRAAVSNDAVPQRLAHLVLTTSELPSGLGYLVDKWRGAVPSHVDNGSALERLSKANQSTKPPILMLGLDGIDEIDGSDSREKARRLIKFFWTLHQEHKRKAQPPPARLVVSCRDQDELDTIISSITGKGIL